MHRYFAQSGSMSKSNTLGKTERLKSRKGIQQLFADGRKIVVTPFRVLFLVTAEAGKSSLSFGTGVSAKNFKKAVDRNRIKRLTREAYRLQKTELKKLLEEKGIHLNLFFIYTAKELPVYQDIYDKTGSILSKLVKQLAG
jgi:ribonuclease P protein component